MASPTSHFQGKHALITGGSGGIGTALARRLLELGSAVTLAARRPQPLVEAARSLRAHRPGAHVGTISLDVTDEAAVAERLPGELSEQPLDILVNCAGIARPAEFAAADPAELRAEMEVNYFGAVWTTRAVVPGFLERGAGHIVNVGSTASLIGIYGYTGYTPPKFALYGFSEVLRAELRPRGIGVTIVLPGSTKTPMLERELAEAPPETRKIIASVRALEPEEVAEATVRGVARGSFEVIPGLGNRLSTKAYRLAPGVGRALLDRETRRARRAR